MMDGWMGQWRTATEWFKDGAGCAEMPPARANLSQAVHIGIPVRSTARALRASAMVLSRCPGCYPVKPVLRKSHIAHRATKDGYRCLTGRSTHSS